jgi:SAM-dependent methyltransferase
LNLQDETFDLVHVFSSQPLFRPHEWPHFLEECKRVLKPGGVINLLSVTLGPGSGSAYQRFRSLIDQLLQVTGYGFADKPGTGTPAVYFVRMLNAAGFCESKYLLRPINLGGWNNTGGQACYQLFLKNLARTKGWLVQHQLISSDEFDALLAQQEKDILEADFCAMAALISAFAIKR